MAPSRQVVYDLDVLGSNGRRTRAAPGVSLKINDLRSCRHAETLPLSRNALSSMRP